MSTTLLPSVHFQTLLVTQVVTKHPIVERPPQVPGTTIHPTPNLLITLEGPVVVIDVAQQNCLGIQKFEGHPNVHIHRAFIDARCPLNPLHP